MTKSNYATDTNVSLLLQGLADDISAGLLAYALTTSDNWVNSNLDEPVSKTATPALVMQAAEYWAACFVLHNLFDVSLEDSATAGWYEKMAEDSLASYVAQTADEESTMHPYSSSMSPSEKYMERNVRTVIDSDEYEHEGVEDEWETER